MTSQSNVATLFLNTSLQRHHKPLPEGSTPQSSHGRTRGQLIRRGGVAEELTVDRVGEVACCVDESLVEIRVGETTDSALEQGQASCV